MESIKVSVIVPIYNAEKYVAKTIESLLNQTLKEIEIILINDGSHDNSQQICESYAKKDKRIVLINQENVGLAETRNVGLRAAKGQHIMFLDADDLFENDTCEYMYNMIEDNNTDYVVGNYQMMDDDGTRWSKAAFNTDKNEEYVLDKHDYEISFFVMNSTVWNKIYRAEFLRKNNIVFKNIWPSEDDYFTSSCYIKANKGFYTSKVMYLYRDSPNSLSKDGSQKYFKGINQAYKAIFEIFEENDEMNYYRYVYAKKNAYIICQIIDSEKLSDGEKIDFLKEMEWYFKLAEDLKVNIAHESLKTLMELIWKKDYQNAIIEINRLKLYRKGLKESVKKRMSFPTRENYHELEKDSQEFCKRGLCKCLN